MQIPLYIFLFLYFAFLVIFVILFLLMLYHLYISASYTFASFTITFIVGVLCALTLYFTWYELKDVDWKTHITILEGGFPFLPNTTEGNSNNADPFDL